MSDEAKTETEETPACSELFQDAVCDGGVVRATCELCGVEHFAGFDPGCFEPGELDKLRERQQAEPDKYREWDSSSLGTGDIAGSQVVWGCHCGWRKVRKYEDVFWSYRQTIKRYFEKRTEAKLKEAQQEHKDFGKLPV